MKLKEISDKKRENMLATLLYQISEEKNHLRFEYLDKADHVIAVQGMSNKHLLGRLYNQADKLALELYNHNS
jgi:hypothetical protein